MKLRSFFAVVWLVLSAAATIAAEAGFQEMQVGNPGNEPITIGIWYPTDGPAREQRLDVVQS